MAWRSRFPESRAQVPPRTLSGWLAKHYRSWQDSLPLPTAPNASPDPLSARRPALPLRCVFPATATSLPRRSASEPNPPSSRCYHCTSPLNATSKEPAYLRPHGKGFKTAFSENSRSRSPVCLPACGSPWRSHRPSGRLWR